MTTGKQKNKMTYSELTSITKYLEQFKYISNISRVSLNIIKIVFDRQITLYFDLTHGNSYIFMSENVDYSESYNTPFDRFLNQNFTKSKILKVSNPNKDKILKIEIQNNFKYKTSYYSLQLEFTGRVTNAIILDQNDIVIDALKLYNSPKRNIIKGEKLQYFTKIPDFKNSEQIIDIETHLKNSFIKKEKQTLSSLKKQKLAILEKQKQKIINMYNKLDSNESLNQKSKKLNEEASILLSNIHQIPKYSKNITLKNFNNQDQTISIPFANTIQQSINMMFNKAKKLKQKAKNIHIQANNLKEKKEFLERKIDLLNSISSLNKITLLFPSKKQSKTKSKTNSSIESIHFKDFKISYGKNTIGNIELLEKSKSNDIWMHIKDIPSTHVIIHSNKTKIPEDVLELGANICVEYSVQSPGDYIVDYTQKRYVKIIDGSNVEYTNNKSIYMTKENHGADVEF